MTEINNLMQYAVSLEFNPPQKSEDLAIIGIAFANTSYCKEAYFLLKSHLNGGKIKVELKINEVTLILSIKYPADEQLFTAELNYDNAYLEEYMRRWPPGKEIAMVFGTKRNCNFYIINPEEQQGEFQPFLASNYDVIR